MTTPTYQVTQPIPFADLACAKVTPIPGGLCITFPGGVQMCAQAGLRTGDTVAMMEGLFAQINAALMPLAPFFNVLDVLQAIFNCISAIPKAISIPPDPLALPKCLAELAKALAALLAMLPPFSVPRLVKGILIALAMALTGFKLELQTLILQQQRIVEAGLRAAEPGNLALQAVVDCASGNFSVQLANLNESMKPLNRLIGIINALLKLVPGAPAVPNLADLGNDAAAAIGVLDGAIDIITGIANVIPVPP